MGSPNERREILMNIIREEEQSKCYSIEDPVPSNLLDVSSFSPADQAQLEAVGADLDFAQARDRREQIVAACKILRAPESERRFTLTEVGRFLGGISVAVIKPQLAKARERRQAPGRPHILSPDIEGWIESVVRERYEAHTALSYIELPDLLQYHHSIVMSADTLRHRIRSMPSVRSVLGVPMESERVAVDPAVLDEWFRDLAQRVEGVPRQFIFNVDETGCSDYADRREITVLVPACSTAKSVPVPVDRHAKRSTLTACIGADGFRMRPFVIVSRVTAEKDLAYYGYDRHNVAIVSQENAFMTSSLFEMWADTVFFPSIDERRRDLGYQGKVVLLLDGLGAHNTERFHRACQVRGVDVILLVPHASDQTQPLDLVTFATLKLRYSASKFTRLTSDQSNKVVRILGAWFAASAPHHNVEAFMNADLIPIERGGIFYLEVRPLHARRLRTWPAGGGEIPPAPLPRDAARRIRLVAGRRDGD
jgi:hypothetical protein